ncbi:MAG TPA: type II toxin-antitoxin system RelE/ParE family toxin [Terriglobia bacterium]|nr:type II toxin-antitoxin system RelE/ParE family toxin [Terriglobia bacterium]
MARDSGAYADRLVQSIIETVEKVARFPLLGRRVAEADDPSLPEVLLGNYRIIYRPEKARVLVLMVVHGARDLSQLVQRPWEMA